MYETTV